MPDYKCECCNYFTKIKTQYLRHLKSKKHIKFSLSYGQKGEKKYKSPHLYHNLPHFTTQTQNHSFFNCEPHRCQYCEKSFSREDSLIRHQNDNCKKKNMEVRVEGQYQELIKLLEKEREDHKEQLDKVLDRVGNTTINNHTNNLTQTNNVQLNNYGSENLDMLTDKFMKKMVSFPYTAIPKMIKKIHFNEKYPENQNIRMLNKRDGKLQILQQDKWIYVDKKEHMTQLIDDKNYILDQYYEDHKSNFNDNLQNRFDRFRINYSENNKNIKRENNKETELVFWNSM